MQLSDEAMNLIKAHAVHGGYPRVEPSQHFYVPSEGINAEIVQWFETVLASADGKGTVHFSSVKQNFGGLLGVWPCEYDIDLKRIYFNADCTSLGMPGAEWLFKKLVPITVTEMIEIETEAPLEFSDFLPFFITGRCSCQKKKGPTMKMPKNPRLLFNTKIGE
jgi:hypothetical protein